MAWPKGRKRVAKVEAKPVEIEVAPAPPPVPEPPVRPAPGDAIKVARRTIMLHRLLGPHSKLDWAEWRRIRHLEDLRDQKLVWHIQADMTKAGASISEAEAYLDAELARR